MLNNVGEINSLDPDTYELPKEKLGRVSLVRSIYTKLVSEDEIASGNRALCQGLLDGVPPYEDSELRDIGCSDITNINWGEAGKVYDSYQSSLLDTTTSVDRLLDVKTTLGTDSQRDRNNKIISKEITRMLKRWSKFSFNVQNISRCSAWHGIGIVHWSDDESWMFSSGGLDDFLIPSSTLASEDELDFVFAKRSMRPNELMAKIMDEEAAEALGWNVEMVKDAIIHSNRNISSAYQSREDVQTSIKNNRLFDNYSTEPPIELIHCWVKEFDGSITYYITTESNSSSTHYSSTTEDESGFLYKKINAYEEFEQALVIFPYSIGTNGFIHSIRGLGARLYPQIQTLNVLKSKLIDSAKIASEFHLRATSDMESIESTVSRQGNYTILPLGTEVVSGNNLDSSASLLPALGTTQNTISEVSGFLDTRNLLNGENKASMNTSTMDEQRARINEAFYDQWMLSWGRVYREVVRRITNKKYDSSSPGYKEIKKLLQRLDDLGIAKDIFYSIDWDLTEPVRSIGGGSVVSRTMSMQALGPIQGFMDEIGRQRYIRDLASSQIGHELASRYFPDNVQPRIPYEDQKVAELENVLFSIGREISVLADEDHKLHLDIHMQPLEGVFIAYESQQLPLEGALQQMSAGYNHVIQHVQYANGNPLLVDEVAAYTKRVQQYGEIIHNGTKQLEHEKNKQAKQAESQAEAEGMQVAQEEPIADEVAEKLRYEQGLSDLRLNEKKKLMELERAGRLEEALSESVTTTSAELNNV